MRQVGDPELLQQLVRRHPGQVNHAKPNQTKPNQTKPRQTKPDHAKPNQITQSPH